MQVGVILAHGMGDQGPDWADGMIRSLETATLRQLAALLPEAPPRSIRDVLRVGRFDWGRALQARQLELYRILARARAPSTVASGFWATLGAWVGYALRVAEAKFVSEFIGDVIGYVDSGARARIYAELTGELDRLAVEATAGDGKLPVTLVAHSLGTVISSDYVWDQAKARAGRGQRGFHERLELANVFTVGSPLALFSLRYGGPEAFNQPIAVESPRGRWVNVYDEDDPVGMPLKPLNAAYDRAVWKDAHVESGPYLLAHTGYFSKPGTLAIISRKLALDWIALNRHLPPARQGELDAAYDSTLGL